MGTRSLSSRPWATRASTQPSTRKRVWNTVEAVAVVASNRRGSWARRGTTALPESVQRTSAPEGTAKRQAPGAAANRSTTTAPSGSTSSTPSGTSSRPRTTAAAGALRPSRHVGRVAVSSCATASTDSSFTSCRPRPRTPSAQLPFAAICTRPSIPPKSARMNEPASPSGTVCHPSSYRVKRRVCTTRALSGPALISKSASSRAYGTGGGETASGAGTARSLSFS